MEENYVILKLVSGEQVMATLKTEDDNFLELHYPMVIRMIPFIEEGRSHEHVTAAPLCQFTDDTDYRIPRSSVMFLKKLHDVMIPHYNRLVDEHAQTVLVRSNRTGNIERVEQEELTIEEIQRRIAMLEELAEVETTEEEAEETRTYVEGNDTVH